MVSIRINYNWADMDSTSLSAFNFYNFMEKATIAFTYEEIFKAYNDCKKNKSNTINALKFLIDKEFKLIELCDEINNSTYQIGPSIAFIVKYPVLREVFAADFRDRIVHHLVMNELLPIFEEKFIDSSFSCRKEKGVLCGVKAVANMIDEATAHYTKDCWILKMDIKSFFMSIDKIALSNKVDQLIVENYPENRKKQKLRDLCKQIIMHHPENNCSRKGDLTLWKLLPKNKSLFSIKDEKGLPIGNLTSQIFANFYLNELDRYITETLGFKYYGRYVDDFVIISDDKEKLLESIDKITVFGKEKLDINIHPQKRYIQHYSKGIRFIGGIIKPGRKYILNRTKGQFYYKLKTKFKHYKKELEEKFLMTVNSYLGYLRHYNSYNIRKEIMTNEELLKEWLPHIIIDKNYLKISIKNKQKKVAKEFLDE